MKGTPLSDLRAADHLGDDLNSFTHTRSKQILMRVTVEAQVHWTPKSDFTADALATLLEMDRTYDLVAMRTAMQRLVHILFASSTTCEDMRLLNRFRGLVYVACKHVGTTRRHSAFLDLVHPTHPDATPYMEFLRNDGADHEVDLYVKNMFDPTSWKAAEGLLNHIYKMMRACLINSNPEHAVGVLDSAYSRRPELFRTKADMDRYLRSLASVHSERKVVKWKRRPRASEIEAGVKLDDAGYVKSDSEYLETFRFTERLNEGISSGGRAK